MKPNSTTTDHEINGFIDNELDSLGRAQLLKDACNSEEINRQIADYRRMKDFVKNAYDKVPLPRSKMRETHSILNSQKSSFDKSSLFFIPAMTLSILLIIGAVAGSHVVLNQNISDLNAAPLIAETSEQAAKPAHYLLHLSSNDYDKMDQTLRRAENLLAKNSDNNALKIEVIANSQGIDLMGEDTSPFKTRIANLASKGVKFEACSQTIEQLHLQNKKPTLVAEANVSMTAMQHVANGVKNGGIYEAI